MKSKYWNLLKLATPMILLSLGGCLSESDDSDASDDSGFTPPSGNQAPSISGNPPAAVKVGESYSFTPTASDPDGDTLTFSIENRPNWASFDIDSGRVSGNPTLANVGTASNIRISVSDGQASASLPAFEVDVTQVATASTTLTWSAPLLNEDGTTITDLAGYKIYYGKSSGNYTNTITIDNPSVTMYLVENLTPDTYYFAATALNLAGVESRFSSEVIKSL